MKLKAKYDLVLPNGEKVKLGDIFDYDGDVGAFETVVDVVKANARERERERARTRERRTGRGTKCLN